MPQVPLTAIPSVLKLRYGKSPSYQKIWTAVVDARLPAEQLTNGRWQVDPDDVAALYNLSETAAFQHKICARRDQLFVEETLDAVALQPLAQGRHEQFVGRFMSI